MVAAGYQTENAMSTAERRWPEGDIFSKSS